MKNVFIELRAVDFYSNCKTTDYSLSSRIISLSCNHITSKLN